MTEENLDSQLALYEEDDDTWEMPELEESTYNPANDEFKRTVQSIKMQLRNLVLSMRPKHVAIVKANLSTKTFAQTAKRLKVSAQTVSTVWHSPDGVKLRQLLTHLNELNSGVSAIEREQLLWRIALNNEDINPRTSVSAIAEINKMKADTQADQAKREENKQINEKPQVIIQLQDPRLLPTPLDEKVIN